MVTKTTFFAACLLAFTSISAQNFQWARTFGGSSSDAGLSITVDASGNVYTTGIFEGTVDFDPGAGITNLTSNGNFDVFIQKMDSAGNLLWAKGFGGASFDISDGIVVDAAGNVYTSGSFEITVDFDPGTGIANFTSAGSSDVFVQKLDNSGNFLWAKTFGGTNDDYSTAHNLDTSGNVYTAGSFSGTVDFDPGAGVSNLTGTFDVFIQKMDPSGNFLWVKSFGGFSFEDAYSIIIDPFGNIYTTGSYDGLVDFDPGSGTANLTSTGDFDVYVQKLDASGNFHWVKSFGGASYDESHTIKLDASGNIYVAGYFEGTADFDPGAGTIMLTSEGMIDAFVQKMDPSGNFLWARKFGGTNDDFSNAAYVDNAGNIYSTGHFVGTADFDPGAGTANLSTIAASQDIFVQKLDESGNFIWAISFGSVSDESGQSVTIDASGNMYTTGDFSGTVDFDPGTGINPLTANGMNDAFVQKTQVTTTGIVELGNGIKVTAYPNPGKGLVHLSFEKALSNVEITITDLQGKIVFSKQQDVILDEIINIEGSPGVYFLNIKTLEGQSVIKLVKE